ncbi:hypothetical protein [uncultured Porticoccus sp.]|uniref:hypothetical protein n=1 Tax=uncultured Porticoccus sp. TaxID=1256050 RepID=UPI0026365267|nr:hypothetical protein [uncultured Porticoccus sp.]
MDTAVALVKAYLQINGYFCVAEYPLMETAKGGNVRTVSDLDILAFRFPHAGRETSVRKKRKLLGDVRFEPDPALGAPRDSADMIVGEVKRGRARFNPPARKPDVLAGALMRFGCCNPSQARNLAYELLQHGLAESEHGHKIRMVAFGDVDDNEEPDVSPHKWHTVSLENIVGCLQQHLHDNWDVLRKVHFSNDTLDLLAILERIENAAENRRENGETD